MSDAKQLDQEWKTSQRWKGITRNYKAEEVIKLRGSYKIDYSIARLGSERLWKLMQ